MKQEGWLKVVFDGDDERGESMSAQKPAGPAPAKRDWSWLPAHMPRVAALIRERRQQYGDAWVNECWRRGVLAGEPGLFWACEGPLCLGTPPAGWVEPPAPGEQTGQALWEQVQRRQPGACLLVLPGPEGVQA